MKTLGWPHARGALAPALPGTAAHQDVPWQTSIAESMIMIIPSSAKAAAPGLCTHLAVCTGKALIPVQGLIPPWGGKQQAVLTGTIPPHVCPVASHCNP